MFTLAITICVAQALLVIREVSESRNRGYRIDMMALSAIVMVLAIAVVYHSHRGNERLQATLDDNVDLQRQLNDASAEIARQVARSSRPLERITVRAAFSIPMHLPELAEYRLAVSEEVADFRTRMLQDVTFERPFVDLCGEGIGIGDVFIGNFCLESGHPLFPSRQRGLQREALAIRAFEIGIYRDPIDPTIFAASRAAIQPRRPADRREPDLGFVLTPRTAEPWVLRVGTGGYQLRMLGLSVLRQSWTNGQEVIGFVDDLRGSQLTVNVGARLRPQDREVTAQFQLVEFDLLINNRRVAVDAERFEKLVDPDGNPYWSYRFPDDIDAIFQGN